MNRSSLWGVILLMLGMIASTGLISASLVPEPVMPGVSDLHWASGVVQAPVLAPTPCPSCTGVQAADPASSGITADGKISKAAEISKIQQINQEIQAQGLGWTAGETSVTGLTDEEFSKRLGAIPVNDPSHEVTAPAESDAPLPKWFSWKRWGGKDWTTPVRNQGPCGSCWAFATMGMFESWKKMNVRRPGWKPNWAEQQFLSCNTYGYGCDGGTVMVLNHVFGRKDKRGVVGTVQEGRFRYVAKEVACKPLGKKSRQKMPARVSGKKTSWYYANGLPSTNVIKQLVYGWGPIVVAVKAGDPYFQAYKKGIYDRPGSVSGTDHVVLLVGWGTTKDGRTFWIIKNSWGTGWGEKGWMRIYAGENNIGTQPTFLNPGPWYRGKKFGPGRGFI